MQIKQRAQSHDNYKHKFNSTSGKPVNAIKQGLNSFIKNSKIDLDQLSANLSQRCQNDVLRSISDTSKNKKPKGSQRNTIGPGLPLPKSSQSKKLAETYRINAQARKNKFEAEINTPEQNRRVLPQPVEQPQILNEQTFENMKKLIDSPSKKQLLDSGKHGQSPNFYNPNRPPAEETLSAQKNSRNKLLLDLQNLTQSEQKKRFNSYSQCDMQVGTIMRIPGAMQSQRPPNLSNYSTFGKNGRLHNNIQSMSPLKHLQQNQTIENYRPSNRSMQLPLKTQAVIGKIQRKTMVLDYADAEVLKMLNEPHQTEGTIEPSEIMIKLQQQVPKIHYTEPLFSNIWSCFELKDKELQQLLGSNEQMDFQYQQIKDDLADMMETTSINHTIPLETFIYSQKQSMDKILQAVNILRKERLQSMILELSQLRDKLIQRQSLCIKTLKQSIKSLKKGDNSESDILNLKHQILRDIVARLRQKIIVYILQIRVYYKQETFILFEEYFQTIQKQRLMKYSLSIFKHYKHVKMLKKDRGIYTKQIMVNSKISKIFNTLQNLKIVRVLKHQRILRFRKRLQHTKIHKMFLALKEITDTKAMKTLDNQLLKLYSQNKHKYQLFTKWKFQSEKRSCIKNKAIDIVKNINNCEQSEKRVQSLYELEDRLFEVKELLATNENFIMIQNLRQLRLKQLKLGEIKNLKLMNGYNNTPLFTTGQIIQNGDRSNALNMPLQMAEPEEPTFKSLLNNQNPEGYKTNTKEEQQNLKHDIHSLLVDTQNYFLEQKSYMSSNSHVGTIAQVTQQSLNIHKPLVPAGYIQQSLDGNGDSKTPNQLFQMLVNKNQESNVHHQALSSTRADPFTLGPGLVRNNQVQIRSYNLEMKCEIKDIILDTLGRIDDLRDCDSYEKHYSFAVKFLIKEEQNLQTYRLEHGDPTTQRTVTYTNSNAINSAARQSPSKQECQSYMTESVGEELPNEHGEHIYTDDPNIQPIELQQQDFGALHQHTFSVQSIQKDRYSIEDYVQYAQNQLLFENANDPEGQTKLCREMFMRLQIAKSASICLAKWKVKQANKYLGRQLDELHSLNLLKQYFVQLKMAKSIQAERGLVFQETLKLKKHYTLFQNWKDANYQLRIKDNKIIKKFRQRVVFTQWVDYMTLRSDYMVMILQAQRYHSQALSSKALLSIYTYCRREANARQFRLKSVFRQYFKRTWTSKFEKSVALKQVLKRLSRRDIDYERNRYQREFNEMHDSFEQWKLFTYKHRELVQEYQALSYYRQTLIIKGFARLSKNFRFNKSTKILNNFILDTHVSDTFDCIYNHGMKSQIMDEDWKIHRQNRLKSNLINAWREQTVKQKIAVMMIKKRILLNLHNYVHQKNHEIPLQFWIRFRQIVFFRVLKYLAKRRRNKAPVPIDRSNQNYKLYYGKLKKRVLISLLQNIFNHKKKQILNSTVIEFRKHHLMEQTFKLMKFGCLNIKKGQILNQVANQYRQQRVQSGRAFVNSKHPKSYEFHTLPNPKITMQKVYTAWLQYTLESFIKNQVLSRFKQYMNSKLMHKVLIALKGEQMIMSPPRNLQIRSELLQSEEYRQRMSQLIQTTETRKQRESRNQYSYEDTSRDLNNDNNQNKQLFTELDEIFQKNKKWMQEQNDREMIIKNLADQYQDKMLQNSAGKSERQFDDQSYSDIELSLMRKKHGELMYGSSIEKQSLQELGSEVSINDYLLKCSDAEMHSPIKQINFHQIPLTNPRQNDNSMIISQNQFGLVSGSGTSFDQNDLAYSAYTGIDKSNKVICDRHKQLDITQNTDEKLYYNQQKFEVNKSDLSISSFSNLAKDLKDE